MKTTASEGFPHGHGSHRASATSKEEGASPEKLLSPIYCIPSPTMNFSLKITILDPKND